MDGRQWAAEREISATDAARLIGTQFPQLRGIPVEPLAIGWDNTVFAVGEWAFRFPRRAVAIPGIRLEATVLPALATRLPLPIPVPTLIGEPTKDFPWPFWGARLIAGVELSEAQLPQDHRTVLAQQVGHFLQALHDPALAIEFHDQLNRDPIRRAQPRFVVVKARTWLDRLHQRGLWAPQPLIEQLLASAERLGPPTGAPVLSHGDLHLRHVLVNPAGQAAGVIDWGDMCLTDPAVDLSIAYAAFAGQSRAALLDAYGPLDAEQELRARTLAVFLCAALAEYGAAEHDPLLLAECLAGLARAAD